MQTSTRPRFRSVLSSAGGRRLRSVSATELAVVVYEQALAGYAIGSGENRAGGRRVQGRPEVARGRTLERRRPDRAQAGEALDPPRTLSAGVETRRVSRALNGLDVGPRSRCCGTSGSPLCLVRLDALLAGQALETIGWFRLASTWRERRGPGMRSRRRTSSLSRAYDDSGISSRRCIGGTRDLRGARRSLAAGHDAQQHGRDGEGLSIGTNRGRSTTGRYGCSS